MSRRVPKFARRGTVAAFSSREERLHEKGFLSYGIPDLRKERILRSNGFQAYGLNGFLDSRGLREDYAGTEFSATAKSKIVGE